jgi:membrane protease YdiL (CAAX protease family)
MYLNFFIWRGTMLEEKNEKVELDSDLKKPTILQVSIFFIIEIIFFIFMSYFIDWLFPDKWPIMLRLVITHIITILLPPLVFLKILKLDFRKVLRLNKVNMPIFVNTIFLMGTVIFFTAMVNFLYMFLFTKAFGEIEIPEIPTMTGIDGFFVNMVVIALMPGIFEEILFRGTIQRGFERIGSIRGVIITGILFGIMHFNIYQLLGLIMLGCFIGYIVYRTNSLYMGMLAHFLNNGISVALQSLSEFMQNYLNQPTAESENINQIFESVGIEILIVFVIMILISGVILGGLILLLQYLTKDIVENKKLEGTF